MGGLVLARKAGESIMIGDTIKVTVSEIRGDTVRLHVTAPKTILVHRKEVADAIAAERQDQQAE